VREQIDVLVRNIVANLPRSFQADDQLDKGLAQLGLDGLSVARESRDVLVLLGEHMTGVDGDPNPRDSGERRGLITGAPVGDFR
jgi:hypothetical protein